MLSRLVKFSVRFRGIVVALACLSVGYGLYHLSQARTDVFPEFAPPRVTVQTEAPGLSSEQVEILATRPVENAVNGVEGIESIKSSSIQGLSVVTLIFHPSIDIYRARQLIAERISSLSAQLPRGLTPEMSPLTSSTGLVLVFGLTSDKLSPMDLRTAADWMVKQRLLSVRGVAQVLVFGGEVRQFQIQIQPNRMFQHGLSVEDILGAARRATGIQGAGFIETPNQRIILQTQGQSLTPQDVARTLLVLPSGLNVRLGEVADVVEAPEPSFGDATVNGRPGVAIQVYAQYGANTLEVTERLEQALMELVPGLAKQGITLEPALFRPANFITLALHNMRSSLLIGALLVVFVLTLFLFNLRTAAISCAAIPLSLIAATAVLNQLGFSLNTMTLGGLAIAIGEVVDDAVIGVENILRRVRENRHSKQSQSMATVVVNAALEVRSPVVYATLSVILIFIPILSMSGVAGRLFGPLASAYIAAVSASLLVAVTVTPALCFIFLQGKHLPEEDPPVVRWLKGRYKLILTGIEKRTNAAILIVGSVIVLTAALIPFLGVEFLPELREGHFILHMAALPGTSLKESVRIGCLVSKDLLQVPGVRSVTQQVGRAELGEDTWGPHYSEVHVDLKPMNGEESERAESDIRRVLKEYPGLQFSVKTFLSERIEEVLTGYTASVVVNLFGDDLSILDDKAREIARILQGVRGATEIQIPSPPDIPQLTIELKNDALSRWGLEPVEVLEAISVAYQGEVTGQIFKGTQIINLSVVLHPSLRQSVTDVAALPIKSPSGTYVKLGDVATVKMTSGRYAILHVSAQRIQTVVCNVNGRDVGSFVKEAEARISKELPLPPRMRVEFSGTASAQKKSQRDLLVTALVALVGIILLLWSVLGSSRNLILVLVNIPFALVGGVLGVFLIGGTLSMGSLVGFVTLFGITLRYSILLLSHYRNLVATEGAEWNFHTALRGASERLAPILMTALITGLGLLPLAIGMNDPGREIEGPMAVVILCGMITSSALNLLILPGLALRFGRFGQTDKDSIPKETTR